MIQLQFLTQLSLTTAITDFEAVSIVFNNYFTSIAEKTKSNVRFLTKLYADYLSNTNTNDVLLDWTISFISENN